MKWVPSGLTARMGLAWAGILLAGGAASLAAGDGGSRPPYRDSRPPGELAALLGDGRAGTVVVDTTGRPVPGPDGRPLRVAPDGRTLLDSRGRALLDSRGRPLRLGPGGKLPAEAVARDPRRRRVRAPTRGRRLPARKPAALVSKDPVVLGVAYLDAEAMNEEYALYGGNLHGEEWGPQARAVVDHINSTGGIAGRRIHLRMYRDDPTDGRPIDGHMQEICSFFAQQPRPVAVVSALGRGLLFPCLAAKGIPLITDWPTTASSSAFARHRDHLYGPGSLANDRYAHPYVESLVQARFFAGNTRVGLLRIEGPAFADAAAALNAALARAGIKPVATADFRFPDTTADLPTSAAQVANAMVRFRAASVNRVISLDYGGVLVGYFMLRAQDQRYTPRYGLSTMNSPMALRATVHPDQLRDAVGLGWSPLLDVSPADEPPAPAVRSECHDIYRRAGVPLGDRSAYGQFAAYSICSNLLMLARVLSGRTDHSPAGLRAGIEALGSSPVSALNLRTGLSPRRHDGASAYRHLRFEDGCRCFRYEGPLHALD
jgi:hypothetical protein